MVVRYYSKRCGIERLHYVLKSGWRVERLQIGDAERLKKALAVFYVVAWRLLYLTHLAREAPETPAIRVLRGNEVEVLGAYSSMKIETEAEAVLAIGKLGGYEEYRNAKPPGPKALWVGMRHLEAMVEGWILAKASIQATKCESR
jgi:hypothetical protein